MTSTRADRYAANAITFPAIHSPSDNRPSPESTPEKVTTKRAEIDPTNIVSGKRKRQKVEKEEEEEEDSDSSSDYCPSE